MKEANIFYCQKLFYEIPTAKSRNGISIVPKLYNIYSLRFLDYKRRGHISLKPRLFSSKSFTFSCFLLKCTSTFTASNGYLAYFSRQPDQGLAFRALEILIFFYILQPCPILSDRSSNLPTNSNIFQVFCPALRDIA